MLAIELLMERRMSKFWAETFDYLGTFKVEKILKGSLDSIPSPSHSV